jgi:hypothetical protein
MKALFRFHVAGTLSGVRRFPQGGATLETFMARQFLIALALLGAVTCASGQTPPPAQAPKDCPPGTGANAPGINSNDSKSNLSDKLASSKGIICPPAVDSGMQQKPPEGGALKVVPPPGSPGCDQSLQPK